MQVNNQYCVLITVWGIKKSCDQQAGPKSGEKRKIAFFFGVLPEVFVLRKVLFCFLLTGVIRPGKGFPSITKWLNSTHIPAVTVSDLAPLLLF